MNQIRAWPVASAPIGARVHQHTLVHRITRGGFERVLNLSRRAHVVGPRRGLERDPRPHGRHLTGLGPDQRGRRQSPLQELPPVHFHRAAACFRWVSRNWIAVCQVGVNGAGLVTAHPAAVVDRIVAPSRIASLVMKPFQGPCAAWQADKYRFPAGLVERHVEQFALVVWHQLIRSPVQNHERRIVGRHVPRGIGGLNLIGTRLDRAPDQLRLR